MFVCPRCSKGILFCGLLAVVDHCNQCNLALREHEQGDGPAFFGTLIIGAFTAIGAAIVEIKFAPPYWLHTLIWIPFIIIGSLVSLRYGKAILIHMQYRVKPWDFD